MTRVGGAWLRDPGTQQVFALLEKAGFCAYVVGGCVRNALLGTQVGDVDMATDAPPDAVMKTARQAGMRAIPTGIDHGTVTLVASGTPIEVTTFRRDVSTDGRRAVVAFAKTLQEDAHRRDFTINALYADSTGQVTDAVGGLADIAARRLRFIDDPAQRIREDYLRILRYFRFFAWYGDPAGGVDAEALAAIADNLEGLTLLSMERVTAELLKLLAAPDPGGAVAAMIQTGVMGALGGGGDVAAFQRFVFHEEQHHLDPDPMPRLVALGAPGLIRSLRLSRAQRRVIDLLQAAISETQGPAELAYRHGAERAFQICLLRAAMLENDPAEDLGFMIARGAGATMPVSARDLMPGYAGRGLGQRLRVLEDRWIASGFSLDRDSLLNDD